MVWTDPARSSPTASASRVSSSVATRSPTAAKQSSTELSGLAGLNTGDEWRSKPVVEKAANTREEKRMWSWNWEPLAVCNFGTFNRCTLSTYSWWFHLPVVSTPPWFLLWWASFFLYLFGHPLKKTETQIHIYIKKKNVHPQLVKTRFSFNFLFAATVDRSVRQEDWFKEKSVLNSNDPYKKM